MALCTNVAQYKELEKLPNAPKHASHMWADYIEILCLANEDREFSKADALDRFRERLTDLGEGFSESDDGDEDFITGGVSPAEESDRWTQWVDDWFKHLEYRQGAFGEFYPFCLSPEGDALITENPLTQKQMFYIYLLASSNLRYFQKTVETPLTSDFELVSSKAMKELLPTNAEVHIFGANALHQGKYRGNLMNKIKALAVDLREKVTISETEFPPQAIGDKGLDIVAWVPFPDSAPGLPIYFGQCGCTIKWVDKQHSCSHRAWSRTVSFLCPPGSIAFIPFCFRNSLGGWYKESDIQCTLIIDRLRIIHLLQSRIEDFEPMRSYHIVEEILQQRESIF